ncbi:MAG: glycerol-3-phosphate 1-O-acyltransferase PlsY [Acidobacteria bacterium]|nr:glycerol-3-phosphate 1-O-acyltransferase PlsY [Acidobacteriota bacterium]
MSQTTAYFATAGLAYLLGSIPFGYILVRLFLRQDIRATGSGNIGATNVARSGRRGLGMATLILDAAKGAAAVLVAGWFAAVPNPLFAAAIAALFAIVGHIFPVWLKFHGGKGVATGAGAFIALAPLELGIALAIFTVVVFATRYVSLGSIAATLGFPVLLWSLRPEWRAPICFAPVVVSSVLILVRHRENIGRLVRGTENRFGKAKLPPPAQLEKQS